MEELFRFISSEDYGKTLPKGIFHYQNTGLAKYKFTARISTNSKHVLEKVECPIVSCANHLENHDEDYTLCNGGCHGVRKEDSVKQA